MIKSVCQYGYNSIVNDGMGRSAANHSILNCVANDPTGYPSYHSMQSGDFESVANETSQCTMSDNVDCVSQTATCLWIAKDGVNNDC
jgi:hypothetical protein